MCGYHVANQGQRGYGDFAGQLPYRDSTGVQPFRAQSGNDLGRLVLIVELAVMVCGMQIVLPNRTTTLPASPAKGLSRH